jgi:tryptophan synthase alpha chain
MAEGPTIQRAAQRALKSGMTVAGTLAMVARFRIHDADTPIVLMGYLNPILSKGYERFAAEAHLAGVDGLIMVDCPPEEADPLADALEAHDISLVRLATPTTDDKRLPAVVRRASGFVYYVSVAGVTGVKLPDADTVAPAVARVKAASGLPVAVGFGIRTPEKAAEVARVADGVVVGSALVDEIAGGLDEISGAPNENVTERVLSLAAALAKAVRSARVRTA